MGKIYIVGIGFKPLEERAREVVLGSRLILASQRLFEVFRGYAEYEAVKEAVKVINNVDETIDYMKSASGDARFGPIVLLGSGDPLFFGIGRRVIEEFGEGRVEILPDLSSIQVAFARIGKSWDDALLLSLHGGPNPKKRRRLPYGPDEIASLLGTHRKIAVLTDRTNGPAMIAKSILELGGGHGVLIFVCQRLGYPDEKIIRGTAEEIARGVFSDPNVVIVEKTEGEAGAAEGIAFGLREKEISHSRGLITKDEVRAVTLHRLRLPRKGVFWDIGSGSGSVSAEAARLAPELKIFAIEKDEVRAGYIRANKAGFHTANIEVLHGSAPEVLRGLPPPDRVFVGGSGGRLAEIMDFVKEVMSSGIIVINAVTIETLHEAVACLEKCGFTSEVSEVSVSKSRVIAGKKQIAALNPVFIITGEKVI